jgi:hypothetical protein
MPIRAEVCDASNDVKASDSPHRSSRNVRDKVTTMWASVNSPNSHGLFALRSRMPKIG